jgi:monomeric isocitrate dehydrogenase
MIGSIYKLVCPLSKKPIYVGCTTHSLSIRLRRHLSKPSKQLKEYILDKNISPSIELLELVNSESRSSIFEREKYWIRRLAKRNKLFNIQNNKIVRTMLVKVDRCVRDLVSERVKGTGITIGQFFDEAAIDKLNVSKKSNPIKQVL